MSALLPCPFCGEGADLMELFEGFCGECGNCETTGPAAETEAAAIAAWNQRATPADPDPARGEVGRMKAAASTINDEVCQTLGKVLGYPWFKDDLVNFPHSTEAHGVCVGDHVAESIAAEAAERIKTLRAEVERLRGALNATADALDELLGPYNGGACHALEDEYIVDRADAALRTARAALTQEPGNEG